MKKNILFFSLLSLTAFLIDGQVGLPKATKEPVYLLELDFPEGVNKDTPGISCVYHGASIPFVDGLCQLPERKLKTFFSLIFTPYIQQKANGTCQYIERAPDMPCKWYNLTLHLKEVEGALHYEYSWQVKELQPSEMPLRIPEHAGIIVQLPADYIAALSDEQERTRQGYFVLHLPKILLRKDLVQEEITDKLDEIAHEKLGMRVFCPFGQSETKKHPHGRVRHAPQR